MRQDKKDAVNKRKRIIEWQDPKAVREQTAGSSVLDIIRAIRDGRIPPPPIARLIGFNYVGVEPGEIVIELQPERSLENSAGALHAGMAAAQTAMLGHLPYTTLRDAIFAHPTISEGLNQLLANVPAQ